MYNSSGSGIGRMVADLRPQTFEEDDVIERLIEMVGPKAWLKTTKAMPEASSSLSIAAWTAMIACSR